MRGMFGTNKGLVLLLVLVIVLLYVSVVVIPGNNCEARARAMQTNFYYHPLDGCFFQNADGDWYRVDQVTIKQP